MPLENNFQTTIAVDDTSSLPITRGAKSFSKIFVENFSATTLFFEISRDGISYRNLLTYSPAAATPLLTVSVAPGAANFAVSFDPWLFEGINFIRFTSNAAITTNPCVISLY
jgi:hypothetical protein